MKLMWNRSLLISLLFQEKLMHKGMTAPLTEKPKLLPKPEDVSDLKIIYLSNIHF